MKTGKLVNRLLVCCLILCFLWLTSLQIAYGVVEIVGRFVSPTVGLVLAECTDYAFGAVEKQSREYTSCAHIETQQCTIFGNVAYSKEARRVAQRQESNAAELELLKESSSNCSELLINVQDSIRQWIKSNTSNYIPWRSCPAIKRQRAEQTIFGSSQSSSTYRVTASTDAVHYSINSDSVISHLADYADALSSYNAEYVRNKTRSLQWLSLESVDIALPQLSALNVSLHLQVMGSIDELVQCVGLGSSVDNATCALGVPGIRELYETLQTQMDAQLQLVTSVFDDYNAEYTLFKHQLSSVLGQVDNFYNSIAGASGVLRWIVHNVDAFHVIGDLCGKSTPDWCTFSEASFAITAPAGISLPVLYALPGADELWSQVEPAVAVVQGTIASAIQSSSAAAQGAVRGISQAIADDPHFGLADYKPPHYAYASNASVQKQQYLQASDVFRRETLLSLQNQSFQGQDPHVNVTTTALVSGASWLTQLAVSAFHQYWQPLVPGSSNLLKWLESLLSLQSLLFLFDYLYRGLQTLRIVAKFWNKSVCPLPSVDLQANQDVCWSNGQSSSAMLSVALQALPYVWLQLLLLILFLVLAAWALASVYMEAYFDYTSTCVHGVSNSTFLSRNLYSAAYNYASLSGAGVIEEQIAGYNLHFSTLCQSAASDAISKYDGFVANMASVNSTLAGNVQDLQALSSCVDMESLDRLYRSSCGSTAPLTSSCPSSLNYQTALELMHSGLLKCPAAMGQVYTAKPANKSPSPALISGFSCSAIPICSVECSGPSPALLSQVTQQCSCVTEWFAHSQFWQAALVCLVYVSLNFSRILTAHGILVICWKQLDEPIFECRISCTRSGEFVSSSSSSSPAVVDTVSVNTEDDTEAAEKELDAVKTFLLQQEAVKHSLDGAMRRYECLGWIALLCGFAILVPSGLLMFYVRDNITYNQHKQNVL